MARVYSNKRILDATKLKIVHVKNTTGVFTCWNTKTKTHHYVQHSPKHRDFICDCWWFANRTAPNKHRWGYCKHILSLLWDKCPSKFEEEVKRTNGEI